MSGDIANGTSSQISAPENGNDQRVPIFNAQPHIFHDVSSYLNLDDKRKYSPTTFSTLQYMFTHAILSNEEFSHEDILSTISVPSKESFGDFQCNDSMKLSKSLKSRGISKSPLEVAESIVKNLPESEIFERPTISKPGFINITLKKDYIKKNLESIILEGVKPPFIKSRTVVVDFSSPNIAKEMHVGHLRSTILGETICRIFEFVGFNVLRINHVGDWGTQFGMLIAHLEESYKDDSGGIPKISDLQVFYKESKKRFDSDEEFKKRAHDIVVLLQSGDKIIRNSWSVICSLSRIEFQKVYDRLEVTLEEKGESFYQDMMSHVVLELEEKGITKIEDGCKIVHVSADKVPLLLVKSDGAFTYDTSDMATLKYRLFEQKADWVIYVVDIGQKLHFHKFFEVGYKMGWYDPKVNRIEHIGFGVILGEDNKKFKTRSGTTIRLVDLLDEGVKRAEAATRAKAGSESLTDEEIREIAIAKGYGCIRYNDMAHTLSNDYKFSFDRMLDERGNTAVYLLYAYARIRSIIRSSKVSEDDIRAYVSANGISLQHDTEIKLAKKLILFPDTVFKIVYDTYPHFLCEYTYSLACSMTSFYDNCVCIDKDPETGEVKSVNMDRMALVLAVSLTLRQAFFLLGIKPLERM